MEEGELMKLNVRLLRKIQRHILEEPKRFIMGDVIVREDPGVEILDDELIWKMPKCGTAACIAGWALLLSGKRGSDMSKAAKLLGIEDPDTEGYDGDSALFYTSKWPAKFYNAWNVAKSNKARARVAVRRIEHFIKTKGKE
jgi:hypothetical protein